MKKAALLSILLLAAWVGLLPLGCGKDLDPESAKPVTVVVLWPTSSPTATPSATPQPSLAISWVGLPAANTYPAYNSRFYMTTLQLILQAQGQEPVSVGKLVFGGVQPPSAYPPLLYADNLADDPAAQGDCLYGTNPGFPQPLATGSWSVTETAFTGIQGLILAPSQPQTLLLVFDFVGDGSAGLTLPPGNYYFSILTAPSVTAYGVSTGLPAAVTGGPIVGNIQDDVSPQSTPPSQPTQQATP